LSQAQRTTILELHAQGMSKREIARVLGISRPTVRRVLRSNIPQVPELHRRGYAARHRAQHLARLAYEALVAEAVLTPKPGLVDCRRAGSHTDLSLKLMLRSAGATEPFFVEMAELAGRSHG
jgi:DNA-binding CsgD family transcriptional regulator